MKVFLYPFSSLIFVVVCVYIPFTLHHNQMGGGDPATNQAQSIFGNLYCKEYSSQFSLKNICNTLLSFKKKSEFLLQISNKRIIDISSSLQAVCVSFQKIFSKNVLQKCNFPATPCLHNAATFVCATF